MAMTNVVAGAATIGPRYRLPSSTELPLDRSWRGNQRFSAITDAGQSADCPTPNRVRMPTKDTTLKPRGVAMVNADHNRLAQTNARRAPNFCANHPAGT